MTFDSLMPLAERRNGLGWWHEVPVKGPQVDAMSHSHVTDIHSQDRPLYNILVPRHAIAVEDRDGRADRESSKSILDALGMCAREPYRKEPRMFNRSLPARPSQKYRCKLTNEASLTPPVGRPLSGPPQLVNMLQEHSPEALQDACRKKRGTSPTTIDYSRAQASFLTAKPNVCREMSPDERLFVEAAAALSHAETGNQPRPAAKKPKQMGLPPPPFTLQQPR